MEVLAVVLWALTLASAVSSAVKIQAKNDSMFEEVVGGYVDDIIYVRSQVAILERSTLLGSGNIIKENVILSVAHILYGRDKAHLKVRSGSNFYDRWGLLVQVAGTIIHAEYSHCEECYKFDIALAILENPVVVHGIHASVVKLCTDQYSYPPGAVGSVSSWGATEPNGPPSPILMTITLPILDTDRCISSYGPEVASDHICGGNGRNHLCSEDSGAGLIVNARLVGLSTLGGHCGLVPAAPSAFTRIEKYRNWILENTGV